MMLLVLATDENFSFNLFNPSLSRLNITARKSLVKSQISLYLAAKSLEPGEKPFSVPDTNPKLEK